MIRPSSPLPGPSTVAQVYPAPDPVPHWEQEDQDTLENATNLSVMERAAQEDSDSDLSDSSFNGFVYDSGM